MEKPKIWLTVLEAIYLSDKPITQREIIKITGLKEKQVENAIMNISRFEPLNRKMEVEMDRIEKGPSGQIPIKRMYYSIKESRKKYVGSLLNKHKNRY